MLNTCASVFAKFAVLDEIVGDPGPIFQVAFTTVRILTVAVAPTIIARENRASFVLSVASCCGDVRLGLCSCLKELALAVHAHTRTTVLRAGRNAGELARDLAVLRIGATLKGNDVAATTVFGHEGTENSHEQQRSHVPHASESHDA
jgi:hypothetical protein